MRALAVHPDVLVVVSRVWQTTAAIVRAPADTDAPSAAGGGSTGPAPREAFLIDSPVYPDELELTAQVAGQAGFAVAGLLATHGDWDHVLGRFAFPEAALGVAETTAARLSGHSGEAVRALREFDAEHYVDRSGGPGPSTLKLGELQALPVPGKIALGGGDSPEGGAPKEHELELHPTPGHTADGMAIWVPWARTLICGDYLSPVEIPTWHDHEGSRSQYRATLDVLKPLVDQADWVIPGRRDLARGRRLRGELRDAARPLRRGAEGAAREEPGGVAGLSAEGRGPNGRVGGRWAIGGSPRAARRTPIPRHERLFVYSRHERRRDVHEVPYPGLRRGGELG